MLVGGPNVEFTVVMEQNFSPTPLAAWYLSRTDLNSFVFILAVNAFCI